MYVRTLSSTYVGIVNLYSLT